MRRWQDIAAGTQGRKTVVGGVYLSALLAMGLGSAMGQGQAIDPVNVAGQSGNGATSTSPAVLVPGSAVAPAAPTGNVPSAAAPVVDVPPAIAPSAPAPAAPVVPTAAVPAAPTNVQPVIPPAPVAPSAPVAQKPAPGAPTQGVVPADVGNGISPTLPAPAAQAPVPTTPSTVSPAPAPAPVAETPAPTPTTPIAPVTPAPAVAEAPATAPATMPGDAVAIAQDGKAYPLTALKVDYKAAHPEQPPIGELMNMEVKLGVVEGGYVAPRAGVPLATVKLGELGKAGPQKIYRSGIAAIYGDIVRFYNARGIIGVFVVVDANDIDTSDADIRPADRTALQLIVVTSTVKQVRTVAIGQTNESERVDNPRHNFIREHSPLQPAPVQVVSTPPATTQADTTQASTEPTTEAAPVTGSVGGERHDLLKKDVLDDYVLRLNRYPGRRVDVAVSGTNDPGGVTLDYLVSESRPWYVYGQISNTGTKQTNAWRERFGFVDNQVTGHDDILSLDYTTAGFDASHAVIGSYELPFLNLDRIRYKVYGSWNEYTASDVGQNNEQFTGNSWTAGNELIANIFQRRELFVDAIAGVRYEEMETQNITAQTNGRANYIEPYLGLKLERATDIATTTGGVTLLGYVTDAKKKDIEGLGRADPTRDPVLLQFDFGQSFYLEPLIDPVHFAQGSSTLAHEVFISMRGQYAFQTRLVPQAEDIAGGLFSVRGYPESIVAGDSVIVATAEYRFHVPRVFAVQSDPTKTPFLWDKSFRFAPQQVYGHPDWDTILRAFVDVGEVVNSDRETFEKDATLVGVGLGVEFQYRQNFNVRVDWGVALTPITDSSGNEAVRAGDNRFHITSTILY